MIIDLEGLAKQISDANITSLRIYQAFPLSVASIRVIHATKHVMADNACGN